ncbi:hypothetical protein BTM25_53600 [Actinomadura rubteroloni]|uniref:Uncharacterized protein n=1 Tax=Actinomadura rubteroloni TaxID=1926885 RepID=A0A2P4UBI6_9ACTN|nr:hypothetical protein [Actinomadura rubteroloni]POM22410.1 hypothetical protein BTM25_53600 [Actinomadura rubteroloni]
MHAFLEIPAPGAPAGRFLVAGPVAPPRAAALRASLARGRGRTAALALDLLGSPYLTLTACPAPPVPDDLTGPGIAAVRRAARHTLVTLRPDPSAGPSRTGRRFLAQRLVARAAAHASGGCAVDLDARRILDRDVGPPREPDAFVLDFTWLSVFVMWAGSGRIRAFTRGLARFGLPELSVRTAPLGHLLTAANVLRGTAAGLLNEYLTTRTRPRPSGASPGRASADATTSAARADPSVRPCTCPLGTAPGSPSGCTCGSACGSAPGSGSGTASGDTCGSPSGCGSGSPPGGARVRSSGSPCGCACGGVSSSPSGCVCGGPSGSPPGGARVRSSGSAARGACGCPPGSRSGSSSGDPGGGTGGGPSGGPLKRASESSGAGLWRLRADRIVDPDDVLRYWGAEPLWRRRGLAVRLVMPGTAGLPGGSGGWTLEVVPPPDGDGARWWDERAARLIPPLSRPVKNR